MRDPAADNHLGDVEEGRHRRAGERERPSGVREHGTGVGVARARPIRNLLRRQPGRSRALRVPQPDRRPRRERLKVAGLLAGADEIAVPRGVADLAGTAAGAAAERAVEDERAADASAEHDAERVGLGVRVERDLAEQERVNVVLDRDRNSEELLEARTQREPDPVDEGR